MLNACTIIACNYLPFARVLAESFRAHHPEGQFTILLVDDEQRAFTPPAEERVTWRRLSDIGLEAAEIRLLAGIYDVTELATAVKPMLLRKLLDEGRDEVVYLDPDIRIYDSLDEVARLAAAHGIVLTPHTMQPYPKDERQIESFFILAAGVYNLGFIGVGGKSRPFLDWWWDKTRREALIAPTRMMFTDQRWVDFVPSFFEHYILKDPGYNVAYWNLHGRELRAGNDGYLVDGAPLRFFHFSGFDPRKPWLLSKHQGERPRVLLSERPVLAAICDDYRQRLEAYGATANGRQPYGWGRLPSGQPLTPRMRRLYWDAIVEAEQGKGPEPPGPFDVDHPDAFVRWLNTPTRRGPRGVSRFLFSIYEERPDLRVAFPDVGGRDAGAFANWVTSDGIRQEEIPEELLPRRELPASDSSMQTFEEGVNIAGYFRAELGIGEAARQLAAAVEAAGIRLSTKTYDATLNRQSHPFEDRLSAGAAYDINVVCVNADSTPKFAADIGSEFFRGRHTAGYWFWEVEDFPESMHGAFEFVDEVWTASGFINQAIRSVGRKPVFTIPLPVAVPEYGATLDRAYFGLSDAFTFVFIFDFLSIVERKNPVGLIKAFSKAFAPGEGPVLILKSINGHLRLGELERLRAAIGTRSDIRIIDGYYSVEEKNALVGVSDCYVSLHRSEGLGLTMAEAMALGKPVIATGYSGNLHFMTPENSYLVGYHRIDVPPGCGPYPPTTEWAEPDENQAAAFMREVYERPDAAGVKGAKARQDILERHNLQVSAQAVRERVEAIRATRRTQVGTRAAVASIPPPRPMGVEHLEALLGPLSELSTVKLSAEGRPLRGLRLMAQRAFFRVLRPLWFQQHQFYAQVVAAFRLTSAAIRAEERARETVDARVRELMRRVLANRREVDRLRRAFEQLDQARPQPDLQTAESTFQHNAAAHLEALTGAVQKTEQDLADLTARLYASPYMADAARFADRDAERRERLGYRARGDTPTRGFYVGFEDRFRGPEPFVRTRQEPYLELLKGRGHVIDLGCGRGEMLDVLREAGMSATGVDADADMVAVCRAKGHAVVHQDMLAFMRAQEPDSVPAVFSAQVIEHLPFASLKELLDLCRSRLQPGGVFIAETINPHSLEAFKTFSTDLTHQHPIFPEVALTWCELVGFDEAYIFFPTGVGDAKFDRRSQGEYAVVATVKP